MLHAMCHAFVRGDEVKDEGKAGHLLGMVDSMGWSPVGKGWTARAGHR